MNVKKTTVGLHFYAIQYKTKLICDDSNHNVITSVLELLTGREHEGTF